MDIWVALTRLLLEVMLSHIALHICHGHACVEDIWRALLLDPGKSVHWTATETHRYGNGRRQRRGRTLPPSYCRRLFKDLFGGTDIRQREVEGNEAA